MLPQKPKSFSRTFLSSWLAGAVIALGVAGYLAVENRIIGSLLMSFSWIIICGLNMWLVTEKSAHASSRNDWIRIPVVLVGNVLGAVCLGYLIRLSNFSETAFDSAMQILASKNEASIWSTLASSVLCGAILILVHEGHQHIGSTTGSYLVIPFGITLFMVCGFDFCILNVAFAAIANMWGSYILKILVSLVGNFIGSFIVARMYQESIRISIVTSEVRITNRYIK